MNRIKAGATTRRHKAHSAVVSCQHSQAAPSQVQPTNVPPNKQTFSIVVLLQAVRKQHAANAAAQRCCRHTTQHKATPTRSHSYTRTSSLRCC